MVKPAKNKASRITTACNPCRSRKQKCSGRRPKCEQCTDLNRICEWPEQLKRGPVKGYVEALEQRLQETEEALLQLVSQLNQQELASMLSNWRVKRPQEGASSNNAGNLSISRKHGVEYWKSFPLHDAASIREWEQDFHRNRRYSKSIHYGGDEDDVSPRSFEKVQGKGLVGLPGQYSGLQSHRDNVTSVDLERGHSTRTHPIRQPVSEDRGGDVQIPPRDLPLQSTTRDGKEDISFISWEGAPSREFQEQFLW